MRIKQCDKTLCFLLNTNFQNVCESFFNDEQTNKIREEKLNISVL